MGTILKLTGGGARTVPPFLKKMQFLGADGTPTPLYSQFKTDGGRSQAAYEGLRNAYGELFRRNEYIHKAEENSAKDTIVEITGLTKKEQTGSAHVQPPLHNALLESHQRFEKKKY